MIRMIILVGGLLVTNGALGNLLGVPSYWAFPFNGCSHGLAVAAPGHGQVALGAKKVALGPPGPGPSPLSIKWRAPLRNAK